MDSNKNNSSHDDHISPPLTGGQNTLLDTSSSRNCDKIYEELIRKIVREEIHFREEHCKMSHNNLPPPRLLPDPKISAQYQLQFMNKVKNPTFTTDLVRDENGHPIKVAIYDTYAKSNSIISPDNILSSAKVRLILLDAEYCTNRVNWSPSEFVQNVLTERERKGPILTGRSLIIQLENGVGTFENIVFNDNSSWTKSGFRLGVMVTGEGEEGYLNGERVQEAVSESFRVLDRRAKASQKPDLLKLTHSIQCIKKIGKGRASSLKKKKIKTVEDFLKLYYNDEPTLREILCIKSESGKEWESMVEHATQCANEFHAKYNALNNSSQPRQYNALNNSSQPRQYNALNNSSQPRPALVHPTVRNMSLCTNGGLHVAGSGSSEPNPSENKIIEAKQGQLSPICDSSSMNVLNEHISTAAVERGNILNGNSVHRTNGVDAESSPNYNTRVRPGGGGGGGGYRHERFPGSFPPRDTHGWSHPQRPLPPSYRPRQIMFAVYYSSCH